MKNCRATKGRSLKAGALHRCYLAAHRVGKHACVCGLEWDHDKKQPAEAKLSPRLRALVRWLVREAFAEAEAAQYHRRRS